MSFKYINPGYANLLDVEGGTTVEGMQYSKTGLSFWQANGNGGIVLAESPAEFYAKFDVYLKSSENLDVWGYLTSGTNDGISVRGYGKKWIVNGIINGSVRFSDSEHVVKDAVNSIWVHVREGNPGESILRVLVNGYEIGNLATGNIYFYGRKNICISSDSDKLLMSSIIISDMEISLKEQVIALPVMETETDMTDRSDGSYLATAEGQHILQKVDVTRLIEDYGGDSEVTGLALVGNPAYRTAEGLSSMTAISKDGDVITEYGSYELKTGSSAGILDSRSVSIKISDLSGLRFGWKAG